MSKLEGGGVRLTPPPLSRLRVTIFSSRLLGLKLKTGFDRQMLIWYIHSPVKFGACIADDSSALLRRRANAQNVSYTPNLTGEKHTILHINHILLIKTHYCF